MKTNLNIPAGLSEFARDEALGWSRQLSGDSGALPTEQTQPSDLPAVIDSPANGDQASGVLSILGRASSPEFESYELEYHGDDGNWVVLMDSPTPVEGGVLGVWDTTLLPSGLYTLRLTVFDEARGELSFSIQVVVAAPGEAEPAPDADNGGGGGRGRGRNDD